VVVAVTPLGERVAGMEKTVRELLEVRTWKLAVTPSRDRRVEME
jgi:hypothetical protein